MVLKRSELIFSHMRYDISSRDRRINPRVVLVDAVNRSILLTKIAHIIVSTAKHNLSVNRPDADIKKEENILRSSQRSSRMTGGVVDVSFQTVESVPVVELGGGLRGGIVAEVVVCVYFGAENGAELGSPDSQLDCMPSQ